MINNKEFKIVSLAQEKLYGKHCNFTQNILNNQNFKKISLLSQHLV